MKQQGVKHKGMDQGMMQVFVYGTLRKDGRYHHLMAGAACITEQCYMIGTLYDTGEGYPAMTQQSGSKVYGELYLCTPEIMVQLDELEGYAEHDPNNEYDRVVRPVYTDTGMVDAYTYIYSIEKANGLYCIEHGDWKGYNAEC